jgi:hypothetical protein
MESSQQDGEQAAKAIRLVEFLTRIALLRTKLIRATMLVYSGSGTSQNRKGVIRGRGGATKNLNPMFGLSCRIKPNQSGLAFLLCVKTGLIYRP